MPLLKLKRSMSENLNADLGDIVATKTALNRLGYYQPRFGKTLGAWVDHDLFAGIRQFQRDRGLEVDGLVVPGGPTETAINQLLIHAGVEESTPPSANEFSRRGRSLLNVGGLMDYFRQSMLEEEYPDYIDGPRPPNDDGKCRATGTCENIS